MSNGRKIGIALGGTAPAMTLMSGAMLAFDECNVEFDVISTTGVGGLIGMLYLAPKGKSRKQALSDLPNLFVSDWLYQFVPVNFKVFHKNSPFAAKFYDLRKHMREQLDKLPIAGDEAKRFIGDWMELWATALTPVSSQFARSGFMSHVPLVDDLVDFKLLNEITRTRFYLNAFSLVTRRLRIFDNWDKRDLSVDNYNGAQAMYMLFPPVQTPEDLLMTGATRDPTGLQAVWTKERDNLWGVLTMDPHAECFWRQPTDAYDAFQLMLMNPIVHLQRLILALYARTDALVNSPPAGATPNPGGVKLPRLYSIKAAIPKDHWPNMFKWTRENAMVLQKAGYEAALPVARLLAEPHADADLEGWLGPRRYDNLVRTSPSEARSRQFLDNILSPIFSRFDQFIDRIPPYPTKSGPPAEGAPESQQAGGRQPVRREGRAAVRATSRARARKPAR